MKWAGLVWDEFPASQRQEVEIGTRAKGDSDEVGRARLGLVPGIGRELHAERRVHRIGDTHEAGRTRLGLNPGGAHDGR